MIDFTFMAFVELIVAVILCVDILDRSRGSVSILTLFLRFRCFLLLRQAIGWGRPRADSEPVRNPFQGHRRILPQPALGLLPFVPASPK